MISIVVHLQRSIVYVVIPAIQDRKNHLSLGDQDHDILDCGSSLPSKNATLPKDFLAKHFGTVHQTSRFLA